MTPRGQLRPTYVFIGDRLGGERTQVIGGMPEVQDEDRLLREAAEDIRQAVLQTGAAIGERDHALRGLFSLLLVPGPTPTPAKSTDAAGLSVDGFCCFEVDVAPQIPAAWRRLAGELIHVTGRTIPGQFAGEMGESFDPWLIEASNYRDTNYTHGEFPEYGLQRQAGHVTPPDYRFEAPRLALAAGMLRKQFEARLSLLQLIETQQRASMPVREIGNSAGIVNRPFRCFWKGEFIARSMSMPRTTTCRIDSCHICDGCPVATVIGMADLAQHFVVVPLVKQGVLMGGSWLSLGFGESVPHCTDAISRTA
jgi:hypothetical protein